MSEDCSRIRRKIKTKMFYGTMVPVIRQFRPTLAIYSFDAETDKLATKFYADEKYDSMKDFIVAIPILFPKSKYKAITLQLLSCISSFEYANIIEFCKAVRGQFDAAGVAYHFTFFDISYSSYLLAGNISLKPNQSILCIYNEEPAITLTELKFTENGYQIICDERIRDPCNDKNIQEKIIERKNDIILVITSRPSEDMLIKKLQRKQLTSKMVIADEKDMAKFMGMAMLELSKWIIDKSMIKYAILPSCAARYLVMSDAENDPILVSEFATPLSIEKSCVVGKSAAKYTLAIEDHFRKNITVIKQFSLPQDCLQYSITLSIDTENFPKCEIQPYLIKEILNLPSNLNETMKSKIPVIAFWNNSSVICIHRKEEKEGGYGFLDSWNGSFGQELYISFDEEKPKYNQSAAAILDSKPASVVFDILQILSFPSSEDAKPDTCKTWKFKITKDETNPILVEIENFDGTLKLGTPAFIMALMIKEHLRIIKSEIGEKPAELGFAIFDYSGKFNSYEMKRIKDGTEEACKLLKIKCFFV